MKTKGNGKIVRRDFLRVLGVGAAAATTSVAFASEGHAQTKNSSDERRKARYKADSADVKAYYRVNNYPR
ncbi:MAG: hypothetical protein OJF62_000515 [Pseudolabrys sp.]|jgi:hypothetical protein|nr:hypothetical protein [Pseudolabrys sp.]